MNQDNMEKTTPKKNVNALCETIYSTMTHGHLKNKSNKIL